jgi:hypothetical protein
MFELNLLKSGTPPDEVAFLAINSRIVVVIILLNGLLPGVRPNFK